MTTAVPSEIKHLDFEPDADSEEEFEPLKECQARDRDDSCARVATWKGVLRCCMLDFLCCDYHKELSDAGRHWWCFKCQKSRESNWVGWKKL